MSSHNILYWKYLKLICGFYDVNYKLCKPFDILWSRKNVKINDNNMITTSIHINNQYENSFQGEIEPTKKDIYILIVNMLYFLLILSFFLIQPVNLIISCINDRKYIKQYIGFISLFLLPPINYIWLKYYLTSNHIKVILNSYNNYIKHSYIIILSLFCSISYITLTYIFYRNIRNRSYFSNDSKYGFWVFFTINELITKTLIFHNYIISILTFYRHNKEINDYIYQIENKSNFILDTNLYINTLIKDVSILKMRVESSIYYFNNLISLTTIFVCLSVFLFFDIIFRQTEHLVNYVDAAVFTIFYFIVQCIFFIIIYKYAEHRINLYNAVANHSFLYKYIYIKTIHMQDEINRISAILNWMTLKEILQNDWIDFRIMGISSKDGDLIKKSIAIGSLLIIIFSV